MLVVVVAVVVVVVAAVVVVMMMVVGKGRHSALVPPSGKEHENMGISQLSLGNKSSGGSSRRTRCRSSSSCHCGSGGSDFSLASHFGVETNSSSGGGGSGSSISSSNASWSSSCCRGCGGSSGDAALPVPGAPVGHFGERVGEREGEKTTKK